LHDFYPILAPKAGEEKAADMLDNPLNDLGNYGSDEHG
jgi:hypothetical protein